MGIWKELEQILSEDELPGDDFCQKIFHGPSGQLPGLEYLIIDRMAHLIFVISYQGLLAEDLSELVGVLQLKFPGHFIQIQERGTGPARDVYVSGEIPDSLTLSEGELRYYLHPGRGQNIGFFPDMINGRARISSYINEREIRPVVLNLFSYTCSFSVTAIKAGALRVDNWDMNRNSLNIGKMNHELNGLDLRMKQAAFYSHDIFKSFGKIRRNGPYDLIIMDPPPYQGTSFTYIRDYPKLIKRMAGWLKEGGAGLFCLNAADCSWDNFKSLLEQSLPGRFTSWERVSPPEEYTGRFPERALKCYFLSEWSLTQTDKPASSSS
jgi:23S rRNA (cytosine1962-C5)-methyltransferase